MTSSVVDNSNHLKEGSQTEMKVCLNCGTPNRKDAKFCLMCANPFEDQMPI